MAELPPIVQPFRADTRHWQAAAQIISRHMAALASDLARLDSCAEGKHLGGGTNGMCGTCGELLDPLAYLCPPASAPGDPTSAP